MDDKKIELIHKRNLLMLKLLWSALILDIIVIGFIKIENIFLPHVRVGLLICFILTILVWKGKYVRQIMFFYTVAMYAFFIFLVITDTTVSNYIFIWLALIITSIYQDSRLIGFASLLTIIITSYFFLEFHDQLFPLATRKQLILINLYTILITFILIAISKFSEKVRLKAEHNEFEAVEELRTNKEYLDSFINNTTDAIVAHDFNGKILRFNKAFEKMYECSEDQPLEQILTTVPDNLREETVALWERVVSGGQVSGHETIRQKNDNSMIDVSVTVSPIRDRSGKTVALACIFRDITEKKKTEELLRKSDKLSVVGQLAAGVAHEIRNPLTVIKGFVQILHKRNPKEREDYELILSEVDRIEVIINEYLVLAKPQMPRTVKADFRELLINIVKLVETQAIMSKARIITLFESDLPLIECDENQVKQVFINVIKNAIESMPDGGAIKITVKMSGDSIVIRVADNGNGIKPERIAKLGEPFYTTKEKGTGLGLMVSFKIIENHKGSIKIESKLNEGTTVDIALPVSQNR